MKTLEHPSNRLYRGECLSFDDAMSALRGACTFEMIGTEDDENEKKLNQSLRALKQATYDAETIYAKHVRAAQQSAAAEMKSHASEDIRNIGEALESGDYSTLAI